MPTKEKMKPSRKIAIAVGVLYLTVNFLLGPPGLILQTTMLDAPDYLVNLSANETRWMTAQLFLFMMAVGIACIGPMMYPILKQHNGIVAFLYAGGRIIEGVLIIVGRISALLLLTLSQEFVKAGAPDASYFQTLGELLRTDWGGQLMSIVFCLGALMLYYLLYRSKLVPRWLAGFCFIGPAFALAGAFLNMFGLLESLSTIDLLLEGPLFFSELGLAVWLIAKGFNPSAIVSEPV
jgi:hypothetical protein